MGVPAVDFIQQQPVERAPATERSEVRFLYDDNNLYIGGTFFEDEMDKLVVNELRRDFSPLDGDLIVVNLDTFNDRLNAYNFQTNPACALRDSRKIRGRFRSAALRSRTTTSCPSSAARSA